MAALLFLVCSVFLQTQCSQADVIYVSNSGYEDPGCGKNKIEACSSLSYAVSRRTKSNDVIKIDGTFWGKPAIYTEPEITLSKALSFQGYNGKPIIRCVGCYTSFVIKPNETWYQRQSGFILKVTFDNIKFSGKNSHSLSNGTFHLTDTSVNFSNCEFLEGNPVLNHQCRSTTCQLRIVQSIFKDIHQGVYLHAVDNVPFEAYFYNVRFLGKPGLSTNAIKYYTDNYAYHVGIEIERSYFSHFGQALIFSVGNIRKLNIAITDCLFYDNGNSQKPGGAIFYLHRLYDKLSFESKKMVIKGSTFVRNSGTSGAGLYLHNSCYFSLIVFNCTFIRNSASLHGGAIYSFGFNMIEISRSVFISNNCNFPVISSLFRKGYGGALYFDGLNDTMVIKVSDSYFQNNTAAAIGGTLYSALRASQIELYNVIMDDTNELSLRAIDGGIIFSLSKLVLTNTTLNIFHPVSERNVVYVHNDHVSIDNTSNFVCAKGFSVQLTGIREQSIISDSYVFKLFSLSCISCPYNHYSIADSSFYNLSVHNAACYPCPPGGVCKHGITTPKDNFWGYITPVGRIFYINLPLGYGCTGKQCRTYNSCALHRSDNMCAVCGAGFTENVISPLCISNTDCDRKQFWLLATFIVSVYVLLFLYKTEMYEFIKTKLFWFGFEYRRRNYMRDFVSQDDYMSASEDKRTEPLLKDVSVEAPYINAKNLETNAKNSGGGLLKIIFYFYQIELILNKDDEPVRFDVLKHWVRSFFNFDFQGLKYSTMCALFNATPVTKVFVRIGLVSLVFLTLGLILLLAYISKRTFGRILQRQGQNVFERCMAAAFELFVLIYGVNTLAIFTLLNCIDSGSEKRLYIQGNVSCYNPFQIALMFLGLVWILPFCVFVFWLPSLLLQNKITKTGIFFGCLFPLPHLVCCCFTQQCPKIKTETEHDPVLQRILLNLTGPFKKDGNGVEYLWWEGLFMARRLIIIALVTFLQNQTLKFHILVLVQLIILLHHLFCQPFYSRILNVLETVSLAVLVLFASMNTLHAYDYEHGVDENGTSLVLSYAILWIKLVLVAATPCIIFIFLFVLVIFKIFNIIFKFIKGFVFRYKVFL